MQKLYYWKTNEIFEYIFDFIFDFILNLSYFYCKYIYPSGRFKFSHKRCLEKISSEYIWD